jgi:alginate O-acetyltransferase complex protein AlgI
LHFNSLEYACLLTGAIAVSWFLERRHKLRVFLLLSASYLFYASWNYKYLSLIFLSSSLDFVIGYWLGRTDDKARRRGFLAVSLIVNLGILCTFKYFNFFAEEVADLLKVFGVNSQTAHLNLLLPVGISFYTFQTLSYTIDVYRRKLSPARSYFEYLLFVSFFPQLVAGPIVRADNLLPQIAGKPSLDAEKGSRAVFRIGVGLAKKVVIADFLGAHIVDPVFSNPQMYSSLEALTAAYAYSFQIYADFSAYSDIAIGSAALLGFTIPENFCVPYRASNLREFWQRWHISLSTWLRDYLYIPLGGSHKSKFRTYANLTITMILGGLWHGAAMTFVAWGALHGGALVITRIVQRAALTKMIPKKLRRWIGVFLTFHLVVAAWVFFRAPDFLVAASFFGSLAALDFGVTNLSMPILGVLLLAIATHWMPQEWFERTHGVFHRLPAPVQAVALLATVIVIGEVARTDVAPFIYFQF